MAIDYGVWGPGGPPADQVRCRVQVEDVNLDAGGRADLNLRLQRVAGPATTANVLVILWNTAPGVPATVAPATIDPPGTVIGPLSIGFQTGIALPAGVETDVHFLIDNPAGGAPIATGGAQYNIWVIALWDGNFGLGGPTPNGALTTAW